jgi:hypothetical protein
MSEAEIRKQPAFVSSNVIRKLSIFDRSVHPLRGVHPQKISGNAAFPSSDKIIAAGIKVAVWLEAGALAQGLY